MTILKKNKFHTSEFSVNIYEIDLPWGDKLCQVDQQLANICKL